MLKKILINYKRKIFDSNQLITEFNFATPTTLHHQIG